MPEDHLRRLVLDGLVGSGRYTPESGARVRLHGQDEALDAVVYFHEVHHCALNDGTAWGILLHVLSRVAPTVLPECLHTMRTTHETFATFSSIATVEAHYGASPHLVEAYPAYVPLYSKMLGLLDRVSGPNRRLTVATTLARVCMQSSVLEIAAQRGLTEFSLADVREADLPDRRWARLAAKGPDMVLRIAEAADAETAAEFGWDVLNADIGGERLVVTSAAEHDEHWEVWEIAAYNAMRRELRGVTTLDYAGHQRQAAEVVALVPGLLLRGVVADEPRLDDHGLRGAVLQQIAHDLHGIERLSAEVLILSSERMVAAITATEAINGTPHLFIDVRQSSSLVDQYDWIERPPGTGPLVALRFISADGKVLHRFVDTVEELHELAHEWAGRGPIVCCVGASCLADKHWLATWSGHLPGISAVLVDVETERFLPGWRDRGVLVRATRMLLDDGVNAVTVLVLRLEGERSLWFVMGDRITVSLTQDRFREALGDLLTETKLTDAELGQVRAAALHVMRTESFVGFTGLKG